MEKTHLENLSIRIHETAQNISSQLTENKHPNVISLKELGRHCSERLFESKNEKEQFICFYISRFIEDVFYNLSGDTPYDEGLQKVRLSFYANLTKTMEHLADSIKCNDDSAMLANLSALISEFIGKINLLNMYYPKPIRSELPKEEEEGMAEVDYEKLISRGLSESTSPSKTNVYH